MSISCVRIAINPWDAQRRRRDPGRRQRPGAGDEGRDEQPAAHRASGERLYYECKMLETSSVLGCFVSMPLCRCYYSLSPRAAVQRVREHNFRGHAHACLAVKHARPVEFCD